jgi:GT2 family glycosyltransferase
MVGNDSDWCYTARARNWEVWYCADAECLHEVGVSNRGASPELLRIFQADMTYWRDKWVGSPLFARLEAQFPETQANSGVLEINPGGGKWPYRVR